MRFTTRFRMSDLGAAILIALLAMLITSVVNATTTLKWNQDWSRIDVADTEIPISDRGGHTIFYGRESGVLPDSVSIPYSNDEQKYIFNDLENGENYFALVTRDSDGRESARSSEVSSVETDGVVIEKSPYPDFKITRIGDGLDYSLSFPAIDNAYKYYLFNNGKYVTEIRQSNYGTAIPFVLHLDAKEYNWTMETESKIDGVNISSDRSPVQSMKAGVDAPPVIPPIIPPVVVPPVEPPVIEPPVIEPPVVVPPKQIIIPVPQEGVLILFEHE